MAPEPELGPVDPEQLAGAVGFTAEQLAANREGEVTSDQLSPLIPGLLFPAVLVVAAIAWVIVMSRREGPPNRMVVVALVALGVVGLAGWMGHQSLLDIVERSPTVVEGPIDSIKGGGGPKGGQSIVEIGGLSLLAGTEGQLEKLVRPVRYRVYYLRHTERVLSIEAADEAPPSE